MNEVRPDPDPLLATVREEEQAKHRILVIEDDASIRDVLRVLLQAEEYRVIEAETAARAEVEARTHRPDLLLVDLGLPDGDGVKVIRAVRTWSPVPIIVLSARTKEAQKISALDAGADDYVTKPFSAPELVARVRAALRRRARNTTEQLPVLQFDHITIDLARREARAGTGEIHLTPLEYRVVECLARHAGMIVTSSQLIREVWGPDRLGDTRSLRACLRNLRQKIEPNPSRPQFIVTETGVGYRLRSSDPPGSRR
jgi:two-component system KDP operon response regulator KdpE